MKTLKIILWGVNLLFTSYLVYLFATTAPMQDKDYQGVEKGNELHSQIYRRNNFYFHQEEFNYYIKVLALFNDTGGYDSIILNKLLKIKNLTDAYKIKMNAFSPDNKKNISKIHSLLADYEQEIKAMDTSFHRLHSLDWGNLRSIYSKQRLLQKVHTAIFQNDIEIFSQIASQWLLKRRSMSTITFGDIILMANGQRETITEGENYEADLFLCSVNKTFFVINSKIDSGEISVEKDISYISIPAQAITFDENGECRKKWKAEITIATASKDTTYLIEREYIVKRKQQ